MPGRRKGSSRSSGERKRPKSQYEKALLARDKKSDKNNGKQQPWYTKQGQSGPWKKCKFRPCASPHRETNYNGYCSENCMKGEQINEDRGYQFDLGHPVRSHWERRYADWLIRRGIRYEYEPKRFILKYRGKDGKMKSVGYLPDFYLPKQKQIPRETWVEVKGVMSDKDQLKTDLFRKTGRKLLVVDKAFFKSKYSYS